MKKVAAVMCWSVSAGTIVYAAANPTCGVVWQSPWSALCLGIIGLGLMRYARDRAQLLAPDRKGHG
jgi:hypothetical protein